MGRCVWWDDENGPDFSVAHTHKILQQNHKPSSSSTTTTHYRHFHIPQPINQSFNPLATTAAQITLSIISNNPPSNVKYNPYLKISQQPLTASTPHLQYLYSSLTSCLNIGITSSPPSKPSITAITTRISRFYPPFLKASI